MKLKVKLSQQYIAENGFHVSPFKASITENADTQEEIKSVRENTN